MPRVRAAAEMEPVASTLSSNCALPGPIRAPDCRVRVSFRRAIARTLADHRLCAVARQTTVTASASSSEQPRLHNSLAQPVALGPGDAEFLGDLQRTEPVLEQR